MAHLEQGGHGPRSAHDRSTHQGVDRARSCRGTRATLQGAGPAAQQLYGDPCLRHYVDLDVVVAPADVQRALDCVQAFGWEAEQPIRTVGAAYMAAEQGWHVLAQRACAYGCRRRAAAPVAAPPAQDLEALGIHYDRHHVTEGPHVVFTDDPHPMGCPRYQDCKGGAVVRRLARIGANATVLPGVAIGAGALVDAGSVVAGDVPPGAVVAGNPARVIKQVADLTCPPGWFEHPYTWPPYAPPEPFDPGDACDDVPPRYEPPGMSHCGLGGPVACSTILNSGRIRGSI